MKMDKSFKHEDKLKRVEEVMLEVYIRLNRFGLMVIQKLI